jgi:hypothetical protein
VGHGFRQLGSNFRLQQRLSCGNFSDSFPDLLGICPFHQVPLAPAFNTVANIPFALVGCHHDDPWFGFAA